MTARTVLAAFVTALVAAAVAAGVVLMGPPSESRARRLDERRVAELRQLATDVDVFWTRRGALPASLEELAGEPGLGTARTDPETGEPYGYRTLEGRRFEVCATFALEAAGQPGGPPDRVWAHGAGLQCFPLEAETAERGLEGVQPASGPGRGGV